jgi:hypothetical protein
MLLAKDVVAVEADFINVLAHIPGTKEQIQSYFSSRGIRVPRTNYEKMWEALTGRVEHGGAGSAVFECLRENMPNRLKELLQQARRGKAADLRSTEPSIVRDFFFQNGNLRRVGQLFLEHIQSQGARLLSRAVLAAPAKVAKPYEIALSFAGEDRSFVDGVARQLQKMGVKVFYDYFETVTLLGKDLAAHFAEVYGKEASYCAMFISKDYSRKAWPQFERQHAQARALTVKREYILPLRLDDSEVPGLAGTIGYIDVRSMPPATVAGILFQKIRG